MFEPIAIIGQGCVFPGCLTPEDLWQMVFENKVNIGPAETNAWRVDMNNVIAGQGETSTSNKAWNNLGGYIKEFDQRFKTEGFDLSPGEIQELDPLFKWSFYAARAALQDSGYLGHEIAKRTGLIMGNLSYPTASFSRYYEETYLNKLFPDWKNPAETVKSINRFMSGLPAILTAKALGLKGDAYALDAACASSLYALKSGCDKLSSGDEDMMLIGGVCASDQLFLHVGFTALNALSPSGQSRPFNNDADGLIPSEGAGFIAIKRLKDAIKDNDTILGVIRGIGISNDGKQGGFLSPSQAGQVRSMKKALASSGLHPQDVGYIECHATGTSGGDSVEIKSMQEVYGNTNPIHLSSLKGNIGHSITASGIGGVIKITNAFHHKILPPAPNAFPLNTGLLNSNFNVTDVPMKWESENKNRIAAISNFGFGGNNAHVLIEEWNPKTSYDSAHIDKIKKKIAIIGIELQSDKFENKSAYLSCLTGENTSGKSKDSISLDIKKIKSPPNDLKYALSQQILMLDTTQNLLDQGIKLDKETTGVFIGMGVDAEINRYLFRHRVSELLEKGGIKNDVYDLQYLEEKISPVISAPVVLGTMPNIPANRINNNFDFSGQGFTISAEELSGYKALDIAINAIRNGEITGALVGAVDISDEFVNGITLAEVSGSKPNLTNAAIVIAIKSYEQAILDKDTIFATIDESEEREDIFLSDQEFSISNFGYAHAASGLAHIATALLMTRNRLQVNESKTGIVPILENAGGFTYKVNYQSVFGVTSSININSEPISVTTRALGHVNIHCYSGTSIDELLNSIAANEYSQDGKHRLGILSSNENLAKYRDQAVQLLQNGLINKGWLTPFIHYQDQQMTGEIAFVFTGAASAYPQMGRDLLVEFPGLVGGLHGYCKKPSFAGDWIFETESGKASLPFYQLAGSSLICQLHAQFTRDVLGIKPVAAIGLSSGETNSMFAFGIWNDMDALFNEINDSALYTSALGVDFNAIKEYWKLDEKDQVEWENWRILAPLTDVVNEIENIDKVYLTIVNTQNDCVIGGDKQSSNIILDKIGRTRAMKLCHDIAVHCPAVIPFEQQWREIHTRKVKSQPEIKFYSNYLDGTYIPTTETVADALTGQAIQTIDFPKIIEKAWNDGIRIFVEHGPRNSLTTSIKEILKGREFLGVALDRTGQVSLNEALKGAIELWAAGIPVNLSSICNKTEAEKVTGIEMSFPMHMTEITNKIKDVNNMNLSDRSDSFNTLSDIDEDIQIAITKRTRKTAHIQQDLPNDMPSVLSSVEVELPNAIYEEAIPNTSETSNNSGNEIIDLIGLQHNIMLEAHELYLESQYTGLEQFTKLANEILVAPLRSWRSCMG